MCLGSENCVVCLILKKNVYMSSETCCSKRKREKVFEFDTRFIFLEGQMALVMHKSLRVSSEKVMNFYKVW